MRRRQRRRVIGACPFADNDEILDFRQTAAHPFSKKRVVVHNRYRNGCQAALSISGLKKSHLRPIGHGKRLGNVQRDTVGATEHF
jgi:hypothetical protein